MKEPWTVERFIEFLKRHDCATGAFALDVKRMSGLSGNIEWSVQGWINLDSLVEELNERDRQ